MKVLILAEKPSAMRKIAYSLFERPKKVFVNKVPYFVAFQNGNIYYVASALGHLFTLEAIEKEFKYPVFEVKWVLKDESTYKKFARVIEQLAKDVNFVIIATDYDIEGAVIGKNIVDFLCKKPAKRMKFSTLTSSELKKAFYNLQEVDYLQAEAGIARHIIDWLWGINLSRALMISLRKVSNERKILSIGRVQGPALYLVYLREKEIENFVPEIYYKIKVLIEKNGKVFEFWYEKEKIKNFEEAQRIAKIVLNNYLKVEKIYEDYFKVFPLFPFDTTSLQVEAYSIFGFKPEYTLKIAESLYLKGYISYPRSSSQKLKNVNPIPILKALEKIPFYKNFVSEILSKELTVYEGEKDDPAHPAIIPTEEIPDFSKLSKHEIMIYDLIARRFLVCLSKPAIRKKLSITLSIFNLKFSNTFYKTIQENWFSIYKKFLDIKEDEFPELKINELVKVKEVKILKEKTKAPARYTRASLIKELENLNLGTKATRAEIVKTLFDRKYVEGEKMRITELGKAVIEIMQKFAPQIISVELTRSLEKKLDEIMEGKIRKEQVIEEAKKVLIEILENIKAKENEIGKELYEKLSLLNSKENKK
ncbi:MAG: DNA topoisomerase I [Candidatus Aenigmatarchaeota archaeon]